MLKEWVCDQLLLHYEISNQIASRQNDGWQLHTYSTSNFGDSEIRHYLLFEREVVICKKCGFKNVSNFEYCVSCGKPIKV